MNTQEKIGQVVKRLRQEPIFHKNNIVVLAQNTFGKVNLPL